MSHVATVAWSSSKPLYFSQVTKVFRYVVLFVTPITRKVKFLRVLNVH